jgi:hypothetical protein
MPSGHGSRWCPQPIKLDAMSGITTVAPFLMLVSAAAAFGQTAPAQRPASLTGPIDKLNLGATMRYIQERLNGQGKVSFQATGIFTPAPPNKPVRMVNETSFVISEAVADGAGCTLAMHLVDESKDESGGYSKDESSVRLSLRDVETLEIQSVVDGYRTGVERNTTWEVFPPTFILHILLNSGKSYYDRSRRTDEKGEVRETEGEMRGGFWIYFGEEEGARMMAEAMEHAGELCAK